MLNMLKIRMIPLPNLIPPQYRLLAKVVLAITLFSAGGYSGYYLSSLKYEKDISDIKSKNLEENNKALNELIFSREAKRIESEKIEKEYYEALNELNKLKSTPKPTNRLFDPGNRKVCPSVSRDSIVHEDEPDSGGTELSREAGNFLQSEADRADNAIKECNLFKIKTHSWAIQQEKLKGDK